MGSGNLNLSKATQVVPQAAHNQSVRGKLSTPTKSFGSVPVAVPKNQAFGVGTSAGTGAAQAAAAQQKQQREVGSFNRKFSTPPSPAVAAAPAPVAPSPAPEAPPAVVPDRTPVDPVDTAPAEPKPLFRYASQKVGPSMRGARAQAANGKSR